jgi:hypothetical protein
MVNDLARFSCTALSAYPSIHCLRVIAPEQRKTIEERRTAGESITLGFRLDFRMSTIKRLDISDTF